MNQQSHTTVSGAAARPSTRVVMERSVWTGAVEARSPDTATGALAMLRAMLVDGTTIQVVGHSRDGQETASWAPCPGHPIMSRAGRRPLWIPLLPGDADVESAVHELATMQPWSDGLTDLVATLSPGGEPVFLQRESGSSWTPLELTVYDLQATQFSRNDGIIETDLLLDRKVLFVGIGSMGAPAAAVLVRSGLGNVALIDHDRVDPENLSRHIVGVSDIGRFKVDAVAERLHDINPRVHVERHCFEIQSDHDRALELARDADLVVVGTDNYPSRHFVNHICLATGTTMIMSEVYDRASGGQFLRVIPGRTPCYQCSVSRLSKDLGDVPVATRSRFAYMSEEPAEGVPWPGLGVDTGILSHILAKLALVTLLRSVDPSVDDFPADFLFWGNEATWIFPHQFYAQFARTEYRLDCPACSAIRTPEQEAEARAQAAEREAARTGGTQDQCQESETTTGTSDGEADVAAPDSTARGDLVPS